MKPKKPGCEGVVLAGHRVGKRCGNQGKYLHADLLYCHAHYTIAVYTPERFEEARQKLADKIAYREYLHGINPGQ